MTRAEFLAADRRLQEGFVYQQSGLIRRTTARGERGDWIVIALWRSSADADACEVRAEGDALTRALRAQLDTSSISVERYQELD